MRGVLAALVVLALAAGFGRAAAQETVSPVPSPIVTLDQERLFSESLWGKRAAERIEARSTELALENRQIEGELTVEERALTDRRATMTPEAFRAAADAFDAKVTEIRQTQDAKLRAIGRLQETERQRFLAAAFPVIGDVVRSRGAVAVLDSRAIFLAAEAIDITDILIERIDTELGAGDDVAAPDALQSDPGSTNGD
ncbi:OmpH family outer membrane protein [Defluviimonas sp. WL0050]|uniref:OmpH family outer membrane protein n=1 Tax=Albidovulum litorale TaxID=2984134 RepID=A0ABT2ZQ90_9RHOB|nr:OmpH family outer membrane protein [Defluviimonas sp. WL0050]MCV2873326.1 OmpH family outer membrane protein [Defluviimonas sp. WL0050]